MFTFQVVSEDHNTLARAACFDTPHGVLETPLFAPVGTQATVKTLSPRELRELGASLILCNTYHLYLRPGVETIARLGGLHRFMAWDGPILTDSGGFQVFSLAPLRKLTDVGVLFRSHVDGSEHLFTPERAVKLQELLGADIAMCLDECPEPLDRESNRAALERTHAWAARCREAHSRADQALFGIVQGGVFQDLRAESARFLAGLDFPGYAIGGLSVGEPKEMTWPALEASLAHLPADRPRYLMGVGPPEDILEAVARGVDLFDCVYPTRTARNGALLTRRGRLNIRNACFADDPRPIEEGCTCYTCRTFSRAYLRHLMQAGEVLGLRLATLHNLHFLLEFVRGIRQAIQEGTLAQFQEAFLADYEAPSETRRGQNRQARLWGREPRLGHSGRSRGEESGGSSALRASERRRGGPIYGVSSAASDVPRENDTALDQEPAG
ncbi:MAG: tRNA guanosine(34) transglycosylase Tgt [Anaerolineae bacterium]